MPMALVVQKTPNPNARKFVLPRLMFERPRNFASVESAAEDALAARLMALDGVYNVFCAQDFVTVNKRPEVAWDSLETAACAVINEHFGLD